MVGAGGNAESRAALLGWVPAAGADLLYHIGERIDFRIGENGVDIFCLCASLRGKER